MKHSGEQLLDTTSGTNEPQLVATSALASVHAQLVGLPGDEVKRPREATSVLVADLRARLLSWNRVREDVADGPLRAAADAAATALWTATDAFNEATLLLEAQRRAGASAQRVRAIRERARALRSSVVLMVRHALCVSRDEATELIGASEARGHLVLIAELEHLSAWLVANAGRLGESTELVEPLTARLSEAVDDLRRCEPTTSGAFDIIVDPDLRDRAWTWAARCAERFTLRASLCFGDGRSAAGRFRSPLRRARYEDRLRRAGGSKAHSS